MLPNFVVIGAAKAGTTSLHRYLGSHPDVFVPKLKELRFFIQENNWRLGREWYETQFAGVGSQTGVGDVTPRYTLHPVYRGVPARMKELIPDARLVYVVRHPIERIHSHYLEDRAAGRPMPPIERALFDDPRYLSGSMYSMQIELFLEAFDRDQLLIITTESLKDRRRETLAKIFDFLGVEPHWDEAAMRQEHHRTEDMRIPLRGVERVWRNDSFQRVRRAIPGTRKGLGSLLLQRSVRSFDRALPAGVEERLRERLASDIARLYPFVDEPFDGWGIA